MLRLVKVKYKQGRASIPRKLLDRAGIEDRMVVVGELNKLELWNPDSWAAYMEQAESVLEEVAESLDV